MKSIQRLGVVVLGCLLTLAAGLAQEGPAKIPVLKFEEVAEIAPGVFFRYSAISNDEKAYFGGSNHLWVVFEDYVLVYDANFPKEAGDVLKAIRKTTDKPIRYVLDSHHHGDHAWGNTIFAKAGASVIAQARCDKWLRDKGLKEFADGGKGPTGRKDVRESTLRMPDVIFDDKMVLRDGKQHVELLFLGHAHTPGDAFLYLPKHKILCTGDACVNGAFNYCGHSDTASWVKVMERCQQLDVKIICPGHGPMAGKDLLAKQKRWFVELRAHVKKGIDGSKDFRDIVAGFDLPWFKEWTGVEAKARKENLEHVYAEFTGKVAPWDLQEEFGYLDAKPAPKDAPGWKAPKRIVVPALMPSLLAELKQVAPDVFFVPVHSAADAAKEAGDADAVVGFFNADIVKAGGQRLRWIEAKAMQLDNAPNLNPGQIVTTCTERIPIPRSGAPANRSWQLLRENVRRFVAGEVLVGAVGGKNK